jgi:flagellar hook-associated protein 3 FlgL
MSSLEAVEGTLSSVTAQLQDVKEMVVTAGNPTLSDSERAFLATDLRGRFQSLLGLSNSRDAAGDYMFSGFQSHTPAFVEAAGVVSYQGDAGQRMVQVDAGRQIAVTLTGDSVFKNGTQDVFQTLNDLILLLETPGTAGLAAGLVTAKDKLNLAMDDVISARVSVGGDLRAIDFFEVAGQDRDLQYTQILSDLQDLDYAKAVTELTQQQFMLEAAQKTFAKTSGLSLFNFI